MSTTGIAGFTLGGGIGWLVRRCGLTSNNLVAADVVTADGQLVAANEEDNADLLWGLRGGGGNFGLVTSLEYALHQVGPVIGGLVIYGAADARAVLSEYRKLAAGAPDELSTGETTDHPADAVRAARLARQASDRDRGLLVRPNPYGRGRGGAVPLARGAGRRRHRPDAVHGPGDDARPVVAKGTLTYWRSGFLPELSDRAMDALVDRAWPNGLTEIHLHHLGGAVTRYGDDQAAYRNRDAAFAYNLLAKWADPAEDQACRAWARSAHERVERFGTGAAYLNFLPAEGQEPVRASFGADAYARLAALKDRYDPGNLFRLNHNIRPDG